MLHQVYFYIYIFIYVYNINVSQFEFLRFIKFNFLIYIYFVILGSYLNIKYNNPTTTPGLMYVLAFRSLHDVNMPWDLGNRTIIPNEGEDNFFVPNDTQKGEEIFYSVIVKYDDGEMVSKVTQTYYSEGNNNNININNLNKKDNNKSS